MHVISAVQRLRAMARKWLPRREGARALQAGIVAALLAAPLAHAGFQNGGFEDGNFNHWVTKSYTRGTSTPLPANATAQNTNNTAPLLVFPPASESDLRLLLDTDSGSGTVSPGNPLGGSAVTVGNRAKILGVPGTLPNSINADNAPNLKLPRWGERTFQIGGVGGRKASSVEQTATMAQSDIDPIDGKIHVRFAIAPVLNDPNHPGTNQPFFYIRVYNETKGKELFSTFNFSNQPGIPWQVNGNYKYTDWQGFDISPGNGSLDVGDQVTLRIYVSNCSDGGADHTSVVHLDAVGAFMPGLSVEAKGPSSTKPGEQITYTYNYANNSGVYALGAKVHVAAPITAGKQNTNDPAGDPPVETTFVGVPSGPKGPCAGPYTGSGTSPYKRGDYYICDVGDLNDGQSGSFNVTFQVPPTAPSASPYNFINNGDYNISANAVSPYVGPLVKTNILGAAATVVDLAVTIDNGGAVSYPPNTALAAPITVTVSNLSGTDSPNSTVSQTLTGLTGVTWTCAPASGSSATCGAASGVGPISDTAANLPAGQSLVYTINGTTAAAGTPVNSSITVAPAAGTSDSQISNNTAGMNTPVGPQHNATVNATGTGVGHVLAVPAGLACGNASTACSTTGTTKTVANGDQLLLTPVAHPGSLFKSWTGCDTVSASNVCTVTVSGADVTATAQFVEAFVVTPTLLTGGSMTPAVPVQVESGGSKVFNITPDGTKIPYILPPASGTACTGTLSPAAPYTYTVSPVTADCGFTVAFSVDETASVTGGNGVITPMGVTGPLEPGNNSRVYTLTPDAGYAPVVGGTCKGAFDTGTNTYTVINATTDCTVVASFTNDPVTVTSSVTGGNGSISTTGTVNVPKGGNRVYTFTPAPGYYPAVTGNCPGKLVGNTYTVDPVNANCAFSVAFSNLTVVLTGTVTGGSGTIAPNGPTTVAQGGGQTLTATPGTPGDVVVFGGTCPGTRNGNDFTVANAQSNCAVETKFVAPAAAVVVTTAVTSGTGTVTTPGQDAAGKTTLAIGDSRVWTLTPGTGLVPSLAAGTTCTGTLSATAPYTYTVNNVPANCVANFAFTPAGGQVAAIPTLSEWGLIILSALMGLFMVGMHRRRMS